MSTSCYVQIVTLSPWESSRTYAAMLMEGLCQADGVQQTRCGVTFEDDDCIKIITCFDTLVNQHQWMLTCPYDSNAQTTLVPTFGYYLQAFEAPLTEIMTWYYHSSVVTPEFEALLIQVFSNFATGLYQHRGHTGASACGWAVRTVEYQGETCKAFMGFVGWLDVYAHKEASMTAAFQVSIRCLQYDGSLGATVMHVPLGTHV